MKFLGIIVTFFLVAFPVCAQVSMGEREIAAAVQKEFAEQGTEDKIELEFFGGQTSFVFDDAKDVRVMISGLKSDAEQNKFSATAEIFADGQPAAKTSLYGKYYVMQDIWVPSVLIEKGERITADKLKKVSVRTTRVKPGSLTEAEKLSGLEAKRTLKAGKIINERDVGEQVLIQKGKVVTSVYRSKGLQITAQAEALENGTKGKRIELVNTKSAKKFFAKVIDAETVEIEVE